jgi:hypothetical protein
MNPSLPRALENEAYALSTPTGAGDAQSWHLSSDDAFIHATQPQSRAQGVIQSIAIALLLAVTGLQTFMCFTMPPSGIL